VDVIVDDKMGGSRKSDDLDRFVDEKGRLTSDLEADMQYEDERRGKRARKDEKSGSSSVQRRGSNSRRQSEAAAAVAAGEEDEGQIADANEFVDDVREAEERLREAEDASIDYEGDVNSTQLTYLEVDVVRATGTPHPPSLSPLPPSHTHIHRQK
jgi:hypothetical protein